MKDIQIVRITESLRAQDVIKKGSILGGFYIFLCYLFLTYSYSLFIPQFINLIMHMIIHPKPLKTQHVKLSNNWKNVLVICLHGLKITEWKLTQKNATFLLVRRTVTCDKLKIDVNVVKFERSLEQELLLKSYL